MFEGEHTWWFFTRASGFVAYMLLFASVALGLSMTGTVLDRWLRRHRVYDLHRFLSILTLLVTAFHIFVVLPDEYIGFSVSELLLPLASPYRPEFMALGVLSFYLVLLIVVSFYVRRLVPYRIWRYLHYATLLAFVMAFAHGIGAGADTPAIWARALYAVTGVAAFNLLLYRLLRGQSRGLLPEPPARTAAEAATGAVAPPR